MGKKGKTGRLKRNPAPRFWPIPRKKFVWAPKPTSGPHPISNCLPLLLVIRDILGLAKTQREAKIIISQGKLLVDGRIRRDVRFPTGLMDVIHIPENKRSYRILPSKKGLILHPIEPDETKFKLSRIENKTIIKHSHLQLNLHDGTNIFCNGNQCWISSGWLPNR